MRPILPPAALAQHSAVLGKTGSGKTSTTKLLIEQVVADGARVCILDPIKSDWWGLTSSADGRRAGLPFHILGGPRGHVPLHAAAGKAIGEIVASGQLPLSIIDMADFAAGGLQKFFVDFAPTLLRRMRGSRRRTSSRRRSEAGSMPRTCASTTRSGSAPAVGRRASG